MREQQEPPISPENNAVDERRWDTPTPAEVLITPRPRRRPPHPVGRDWNSVYLHTLAFLACSATMNAKLGPRRAYLGDQLRRAGLCVVLEVAAGAGQITAGEKFEVYWTVRRPTPRTATLLFLCARFDLAQYRDPDVAMEALFALARNLVRMARQLHG